MKERLDVLLVGRGLAQSRKQQKQSLCPEMYLWKAREKTRPEAHFRRKYI